MPSYQPQPDAAPLPPWSTAFLSQRDLTIRIPLNYVTYPGVSLSAACYAHGTFENVATERCLSNLLATGFRRFIFDLYWDDGRRVWSLCPVRIPQSATNPDASASSTEVISFTSSSVTVSSIQFTARAIALPLLDAHERSSNAEPFTTGHLEHRQAPSSITTSSSPTTSVRTSTVSTTAGNGASSLNRTTTASSTTVTQSTTGLIQVGLYSCTSTIDLPVAVSVLAEYLQSSSNTLEAIMTYLVLNLHVAASPQGPPQALNASSLPTQREMLSTLLNVNLSSYLYTPKLLEDDRANLNASWFNSANEIQPDYFNRSRNANGDLTTDNGWPSETVVELRRAYRLLAGFGQVDPQLSGYNFSGDNGVIFPVGAFQSERGVQFSATGNLNQGCFFNPNNTEISSYNNTWAVSTQHPLPSTAETFSSSTLPSVSNLTVCGISPLLNETLLNSTADQNIKPYQQFAYSSIWSWAPGEPRNVSSSEPNSATLRCAALDASGNGRWRVADCSERHYASCRLGNEPYVWSLSSSKATYSTSNELCPDGSSFDAPRTALENQHLLSTILQRHGDQSPSKDPAIWVNFNNLDVAGCWVSGVDTVCPYKQNSTTMHDRAVIVPTVAAIIVFVTAALMVFIKCAANRRKTRRGRRRRRAADDGWDYEGVPS